MGHAAITGYIDVAQVTLYVFWIFFAGLIYYLHREDKREGYPLEHDHPSGRVVVQGFPAVPQVKKYVTQHGLVSVPRMENDRRNVALVPSAYWPGAPLDPTGNPMVDGVGPASYADREDAPELGIDGHDVLAPMRISPDNSIAKEDPDPRGMVVHGTDGVAAGTVVDVWVDRQEMMIRYLEVELPGALRTALLPMAMVRVNRARRTIKVASILASQFAEVPVLANPDRVTKLEEDKIVGYFAGGHLYATPSRMGPLL
jgi:photosynthetic reaction center H subunit